MRVAGLVVAGRVALPPPVVALPDVVLRVELPDDVPADEAPVVVEPPARVPLAALPAPAPDVDEAGRVDCDVPVAAGFVVAGVVVVAAPDVDVAAGLVVAGAAAFAVVPLPVVFAGVEADAAPVAGLVVVAAGLVELDAGLVAAVAAGFVVVAAFAAFAFLMLSARMLSAFAFAARCAAVVCANADVLRTAKHATAAERRKLNCLRIG